MTQLQYYGPGLDRLACAIMHRTYRDAMRLYHGKGDYVSRRDQYQARKWWTANAREWAETLHIDIDIPAIPEVVE